MHTSFLGTAKLETQNISALNILSDIVLYIIGMEIEYSVCTLNFLFIRNNEVLCVWYVNSLERLFLPSGAVGLVLRDPDLNYSFTTCCVTMNLNSLKFI